jgi:hypothetical protein
MNNNRFADDPDLRLGELRVAVRDFLRNRGWLDRSHLAGGGRWISDELSWAVEKLFCEFFAAWHQRAGFADVRWEAIVEMLGTFREPAPFLADPRHDLCEMFCLAAGIGDAGRSFDKTVGDAGLSPDQRSDLELRALATSIRDVDRAHFADRTLPGKSGLLFERIERWPFVAGAKVAEWKKPDFRRDLQRYCDLTNLSLSEVDDDVPPPQCDKSLGQPQNLGTWCLVLGLHVVSDWFAGRMRRQPRPSVRDEVLRAASKICGALQAWLESTGCELGNLSAVGAEFRNEATRVFLAMVEHTIDVAVESLPEHAWFRFRSDSPACVRMWFARAAFDGRSEQMPADVATKWVRVVKQEMSAFRPLLGQEDVLPHGWEDVVRERSLPAQLRARTGEAEKAYDLFGERQQVAKNWPGLPIQMPSERFERDRPHFLACADQVFQLEGLWEGMRQLLLAMRALKSPSVASDLRYWEEPGVAASHYPRQPEEPWRCIPAKLVANFHAFVSKEEANDPELKALRSKFASFCLNGLRDNWSEKEREEATASARVRTNGDMVEASPDWRFCRVRAAKTLAINPEGRGHRLLQAASEMDPDPSVREAANDAYQSLRRGVTLPDGMSPRRAVLGARHRDRSRWRSAHSHQGTESNQGTRTQLTVTYPRTN